LSRNIEGGYGAPGLGRDRLVASLDVVTYVSSTWYARQPARANTLLKYYDIHARMHVMYSGKQVSQVVHQHASHPLCSSKI
jgi:hypothetical protein